MISMMMMIITMKMTLIITIFVFHPVKRFETTMEITNRVFNDSLNDDSSSLYKKLADEIKNDMVCYRLIRSLV